MVPENSQFAAVSYLTPMPKRAFEPCIPTRSTAVPAGQDWIHEIKHDGYRLIVQREGSACGCSPATATTGRAGIR
jgi:ATP-dependent DNA ligase